MFSSSRCPRSSLAEDGEALVPARMGLLVRAGGEPFEQHFGTYAYEGAHMAMAAIWKSGAALLATWGDPYVTLNLRRLVTAKGDRILQMGFTLAKTARSVQLRCLGRSDLTAVARAYRERTSELGYRVPWSEKRAERPLVDRLFGVGQFGEHGQRTDTQRCTLGYGKITLAIA